MEEIKIELKQDNIAVKANAITKLTYVSNYYCTAIWLSVFAILLLVANAGL